MNTEVFGMVKDENKTILKPASFFRKPWRRGLLALFRNQNILLKHKKRLKSVRINRHVDDSSLCISPNAILWRRE